MHLLIYFFFAFFVSSAFSMNEMVFEKYYETLRKKYGITAESSSETGLLREVLIKDQSFPTARLWCVSVLHAYICHTNIVIKFFGLIPEQIKMEFDEVALKPSAEELIHFKIPVVDYKNWLVLLSNNPSHVHQSKKSIELIYSWGLISNDLYNFLISELGLGDFRYENIRPLIRRIGKSLPAIPSFDDFIKAASKEVDGNVVLIDTFINALQTKIKNPNAEDEIVDYLMDEYYLSSLRTSNFPLLMKIIERKIPDDSSDEVIYNVILSELSLILDKENRDKMTFMIIKEIINSADDIPEFLINLCDLISKDSEYYQKTLEIKGQLVFTSKKDISRKKRYEAIIHANIHAKNSAETNTFIQAFINDGAIDKKLPAKLHNLDYSPASFMNLLDYIREQNLIIDEKKHPRDVVQN